MHVCMYATVPASKVGSRSASEQRTSKRSKVPAVQGPRIFAPEFQVADNTACTAAAAAAENAAAAAAENAAAAAAENAAAAAAAENTAAAAAAAGGGGRGDGPTSQRPAMPRALPATRPQTSETPRYTKIN